MSTIPIWQGPWTDWSHGLLLGSYRTFTVQHTLYIVGASGAYLTVVGGFVWSIWAFVAHQSLASHRQPDIVDLQLRNINRNTSTAQSAIIETFFVYWQWKPWKLRGRRPSANSTSWIRLVIPCHVRRKRARNVGLRACQLMFPAAFIFAVFSALSIAGARIAAPAYRSNTVLVKDGYEDGKCGITLFDTAIEANNEFDIDAAERTRAAVSYARTCYSSASGVENSGTCSIFTKPTIDYDVSAVGCPFGDSDRSVNESMCAFNSNQAALALQTPRLDSHEHLGINAPKQDRVQFYKLMVCSPIVLDGFTRAASSHGAEASGNTTVTEFLYGSVQGIGNYTYSYNTAAAYDNVPFAVTALMHNATGPAPWMPVSNLTRSDADVSIVFIAPNSVKYRNQVKDPVFQATYPLTLLSNIGSRFTVYSPDYQVVVIACTEQYSICNPRQSDECTPLDGQRALLNNINHIGLNPAQYVTAIRLIYMIADGNTYSSVDGIGPEGLQISNKIHDFIAPAIPDNQWQLEVRGWLNTTLAKWQAYTVNYAHNTATLGPHGHIGFPISNSTLEGHWRNQCRNQKISNLGAYQNVIVFGFSLIWAVGSLLILLSLSLKRIVKGCRERASKKQNGTSNPRQIAWNIDGSLQQQRLALRTAGYYDLIGGEDDVPYLDQEAQLPLPFHAMKERHTGTDETDSIWCRSGGEAGQITSEVNDISRNDASLIPPDNQSWASTHVLPDKYGTVQEVDVGVGVDVDVNDVRPARNSPQQQQQLSQQSRQSPPPPPPPTSQATTRTILDPERQSLITSSLPDHPDNNFDEWPLRPSRQQAMR